MTEVFINNTFHDGEHGPVVGLSFAMESRHGVATISVENMSPITPSEVSAKLAIIAEDLARLLRDIAIGYADIHFEPKQINVRATQAKTAR